MVSAYILWTTFKLLSEFVQGADVGEHAVKVVGIWGIII